MKATTTANSTIADPDSSRRTNLQKRKDGDDVFQANECSTADEQNVRGIDLDVLLLGVLPAALRGDVGRRTFEHFEQGLLYALARYVAGDRHVVARLADLVDLVDVQHAALRRLDVEISGVQ